MKTFFLKALLFIALISPYVLWAQTPQKPKPASTITALKNKKVLKELPFNDTTSFTNAERGFIANTPNLIIKKTDGNVVWDMQQYNFINTPTAPNTVNPSLWRQERLNNKYGLFEVVKNGIYQIRGYDMSNMTIIEGNSGIIIIDPLVSTETAHAGLTLYYANRPKKAVKAVIYTHSHIDHYGGVLGVTDENSVKSGKVKVYAPQSFLEEAVSENVYAGTAMSRRAQYMYGIFLPKKEQGQVGVGLGKGSSTGNVGLIAPSDSSTIITYTKEVKMIDGLTFIFQMAPHTEAPAEMLFYIQDYKALCSAEDATQVLHNLYTLRGAQVRSSQSWWQTLNETINLFGDNTEVVFASHHWPTWGQDSVRTFLQNQRDLYKYLHDQVLNLANKGYTMIEIGEMIKLPKSLDGHWYNRGYYGSVNHDAKAVYQYYLGFYSGNPADLYQLPPRQAAINNIRYMGGAKAVIAKAQKDFQLGEYRWVAQVMNQVVFADSSNQEAKNLEADALEQLGYQTENATWRNNFLMGAYELRNGVNKNITGSTISPETLKAMTVDMLLDLMGIQLDVQKAAGKDYTFNLVITDSTKKSQERYSLYLKNSVLIYENLKEGVERVKHPTATILMNRNVLNQMFIEGKNFNYLKPLENKSLVIIGSVKDAKAFLDMQEHFPLMFNIVTP
jgi:alkyl sulfatase BDS1-like metallo-beta-lactamase superfamily hydrolase